MTQLDLFSPPADSKPCVNLEGLLPRLLALVVELESVAEHVYSRPYLGEPARAVATEKQTIARRLRRLLTEAAA